jgi:hypothetical protein
MEWVPEEEWLTYIKIDTPAGRLTHDLAASVDARQPPLKIDAGIASPQDAINTLAGSSTHGWLGPATITAVLAIAMVIFQLGWTRRRTLLR